MLLVSWFGYFVPTFGELVMKAREIMRQGKPDVIMRNAASLEFKHPQIMNAWEVVAQEREPGIEMLFCCCAVWVAVVIRQAELRYERNTGVTSQEAEPTPRVIRKALNVSPGRWRLYRTLSVTFPYNLHSRRVDKESGWNVFLRYAAINKLCARGGNQPPDRAGGLLFNRATRPT